MGMGPDGGDTAVAEKASGIWKSAGHQWFSERAKTCMYVQAI